jgi:hypothetical protein
MRARWRVDHLYDGNDHGEESTLVTGPEVFQATMLVLSVLDTALGSASPARPWWTVSERGRRPVGRPAPPPTGA